MEKVRELIQKAKAFSSHREGKELAESFEEFFELYSIREDHHNDPEFAVRLEESHKKFWASFDKAASYFEIDQEFLKQHICNHPTTQTCHQEPTKNTASHKKLKTNNKRVRI
jgi:hypothetical protein